MSRTKELKITVSELGCYSQLAAELNKKLLRYQPANRERLINKRMIVQENKAYRFNPDFYY